MKASSWWRLPLAFVVCGCATLRVDVDVYKGPIANEEQIQIQELVALAIGARPLLVQLRDGVEATARHMEVGAWHAKVGTRYCDGYMRSMSGSDWESPLARNANEVLGLYESAADEDPLGSMVGAIRDLLGEYQIAYEMVFQIPKAQREYEQRLVRRISVYATDEVADALRCYFEPQGKKRFRDAEAVCRLALKHEIELTLRDPIDGVDKTFKPPARQEEPPEQEDPRKQEETEEAWVPANAWYGALTRRTVWSDLLDRVGSTWPTELRQEVADRGVELATAFETSRETLRKIVRAAAELTIARIETGEDSAKRVLAAEAALAVASLASSGERLQDVMKEQPDIQVQDRIERVHPALAEVRESLRKRFQANPSLETSLFVHRTDRDQQTRQRLEVVLREVRLASNKNEAEVLRQLAAAFLHADDLLRSQYADGLELTKRKFGTSQQEKLERRVFLQFGLAAGPNDLASGTGAGGLSHVEQLGFGVEKLDEGGLRGGRLKQGLFELTRRYLEAEHAAGHALEERRRVLTELIRFGEKLRVLSGFQGLLDGDTERSETRDYIDVLQAIANSLLTQGDALQRRLHSLESRIDHRTHEEDRDRDRRLEHRARRTATRDAEPEHLAGVPPLCAFGSAREVLDEFADRLRYLIACRIAAGDSSVDELREALAFVEEQQTRFVYLRHAAAYLRNAYPAPDLQPDPLHLLDNVLHTSPGVREERREIAIKMDKQFWQNVNQISLGGTGTTNYTLAKDDIGNWQIKAYEADTSQIVKSVANLASFALQSGMSPATIAGAAELQGLLGKMRGGGSLSEPEQRRVDALTAQRAAAASASRDTVAAVEAVLRRGAELNAELRSFAEGVKPGSASAVAVAATDGKTTAANLQASHAEFQGLVHALDGVALDAAARAQLETLRTRRLDLLRTMQLVLLPPLPPAPAVAPAAAPMPVSV